MMVAIGLSQAAVDLAVEADDTALAGIGDKPHLAALSGLEPGRSPSRDIEPAAARLFAIKGERRVGLGKMIMRADLYRAIAGIGDGQGHRRAAGVDLDIAGCGEELTWDHRGLSGSADER